MKKQNGVGKGSSSRGSKVERDNWVILFNATTT